MDYMHLAHQGAVKFLFPDTGHVSVSELSPCKRSVDAKTVIDVKTDSLEIIFREADDMRRDVNSPRAEIV